MAIKKYKLLKEFPGAEKGEIFELFTDTAKKYYGLGGTSLNKEYVENNPEWFEEIVEYNRPKTFEGLGKIGGYYLSGLKASADSNYGYLFSTEKQARSARAFAKLSQLIAKISEGKDLQKNQKTWKITPSFCSKGVNMEGIEIYTSKYNGPLVVFGLMFFSIEDAKFSLEHHKQLWLDYYGIEEN